MKKFIITLLLFITFSINAQNNIAWNQVGVVANDGYGSDLAETMDKFYGSIEMPENASVQLLAVYHNSPDHKPTHYINYSGTVEGLTNSEIQEQRNNMDELNTDGDSMILGDEYIEQSGPVKFVPFESTTRMGPYDGLCIDGERKKVDKLISNEELQTYLGVQGPIQLKKSIDVDTGVVVDGDDSTEIKKKAILSNNPVSINCCDTSPFSSSNGCVCVTDKQKKFIRSRGHNKTSPDYV